MRKKHENILIICAHSDDHIFGAGGTIAKYASEGKHVHAIILSYGEKTHPWLKPKVAKDIRARETRHADKIVGCHSTFFDLNEGKFMEGYPAVKQKILTLVKKERPTKIFTHNNEDPHPDHRAAYNIAQDIMKETGINAEVYLFSIWNPFSIKKSDVPLMYVDISITHQKKVAAIRHFRSQWAALTLLLGSIFARELKNGLTIGVKFAERFYKVQ